MLYFLDTKEASVWLRFLALREFSQVLATFPNIDERSRVFMKFREFLVNFSSVSPSFCRLASPNFGLVSCTIASSRFNLQDARQEDL